jgi:hypothetical protein
MLRGDGAFVEGDTDIIKVRLQTTSIYANALDAGKKIYKNEGPLAFYKVRD